MKKFPLFIALFLTCLTAFAETIALQNIEIDGKIHRFVILHLPPPATEFGGDTQVSYTINKTKVDATIKTLPPNLKNVVKDILIRRSKASQWGRILAEESAEAEKVLEEARRLAEAGVNQPEEEAPEPDQSPSTAKATKKPAAAAEPAKYQTAYSQARKSKLSAGKGKINVNTATKTELMKIPGVGERRAWQLYNKRPVIDQEDLMRKCYISKKTAEKLEKYIDYGVPEE